MFVYMIYLMNRENEIICGELQSIIIVFFVVGEDVSEVLVMVVNFVGFKEMLCYVVEVFEDCDWVLEVEVLFFRCCLFVLLCVCVLIFVFLFIIKLVFIYDLYLQRSLFVYVVI